VRAHLDKPSVIRLTLSYIRMHTLLEELGIEEFEALRETNMYLGILEGFVMVLSTEGDMIFLSDNVSKYMGLSQTELMGHNIFEYTHPCDHEEIRNNLQEVWYGEKRDFVMRIKSALTHRGRTANLKSATWKVLHCQGRAKVCMDPSAVSCLLLTCRPLPLSHTLLSRYTFTSQHSMDMRFTYCDQRCVLSSLLGYRPEELLGRSIYDLCHTLDTNCLNKNHLNLCLKSQSVSGQYRMLVKGGGYVWVESHSAVIPSVRASRSRPGIPQPLCILSVTYVLRCVHHFFFFFYFIYCSSTAFSHIKPLQGLYVRHFDFFLTSLGLSLLPLGFPSGPPDTWRDI
uniref:PAS domain-containing protein n=1 Tax=Amphilophus citrinellus TaxID=61819 RepID=A0A3Q0R6R0_AMPCI